MATAEEIAGQAAVKAVTTTLHNISDARLKQYQAEVAAAPPLEPGQTMRPLLHRAWVD